MPLLNPEFLTLDHWTPWSIRQTPELNIEDVRRGASPEAVFNPPTALRLVAHHQTWHAGVYQSVAIGSLKRLAATVRGRIFDVGAGVAWPGPSDPNVHAFLRIGIDPTGGVSPTSGGVIWEEVGDVYDAWKSVSVVTLSLTNTITVFVGIENGRNNEWPLTTMLGFLDSVTLTVEDGDPDPDPQPTATGGILTESVEDKGDYFRVVQRWPKVAP